MNTAQKIADVAVEKAIANLSVMAADALKDEHEQSMQNKQNKEKKEENKNKKEENKDAAETPTNINLQSVFL